MSRTKEYVLESLEAPILPERYFFRAGPEEGSRINYGGYTSRFFGVSIRRKTWYGSKVIWSTSKPVDITAEQIHEAMVELHESFTRDRAARHARQVALKLHSGDYPPKELKVTR